MTNLQSVQPPSVQEDGEADEVTVLCHNLCNRKTSTFTSQKDHTFSPQQSADIVR